MSYSEIVIMLLVYSGLFTYFFVPFRKSVNLTIQLKRQFPFKAVFKRQIFYLILHKKAVFGFILFVITLYGVWSGYAAAEDHINAHSGYPPISTKIDAYMVMGIVFLYSIFLFFLLVYMNT